MWPRQGFHGLGAPPPGPGLQRRPGGRSELSRGLLEARKSPFLWAGWPLGGPGPQLGAAATPTTSQRALPSLIPAGPPSTRLHGTGEGALRPRGTQSARSNAGQEVGWIFHVGSQTKAPGSIFLQMQNRKSGTCQLSVGMEVPGRLAQTARGAEWPRCGAGRVTGLASCHRTPSLLEPRPGEWGNTRDGK